MYFFFSLNVFLDLSNVMNSTPNIKAVNGKAESSDSGAESEEEGLREEEEKELQQNGKGKFSALGPDGSWKLQEVLLYCAGD